MAVLLACRSPPPGAAFLPVWAVLLLKDSWKFDLVAWCRFYYYYTRLHSR
jgi:hypothetical protein